VIADDSTVEYRTIEEEKRNSGNRKEDDKEKRKRSID